MNHHKYISPIGVGRYATLKFLIAEFLINSELKMLRQYPTNLAPGEASAEVENKTRFA